MALALDPMMDSHQVDGPTKMHLRKVDTLAAGQTPDGPQQHCRAVRRQAPKSKGSFLAPVRTHSRGQVPSFTNGRLPDECDRRFPIPKRLRRLRSKVRQS